MCTHLGRRSSYWSRWRSGRRSRCSRRGGRRSATTMSVSGDFVWALGGVLPEVVGKEEVGCVSVCVGGGALAEWTGKPGVEPFQAEGLRAAVLLRTRHCHPERMVVPHCGHAFGAAGLGSLRMKRLTMREHCPALLSTGGVWPTPCSRHGGGVGAAGLLARWADRGVACQLKTLRTAALGGCQGAWRTPGVSSWR